MAWKACS